MTAVTASAPDPLQSKPDRGAWVNRLGSVRLNALAIVSALVVGAVIVAISDLDHLKHGEIGGMLTTVKDAYIDLAVGAFGSWRGWSETITAATPLMFAGVAVALGFKAGLFNIGGLSQVLAGGMAAVWVGFTLDLPAPLHVLVALVAAVMSGGVWGGIVGLLKARTGAHEVITTIMLNYVAAGLTLWLLKTSAFQVPGRSDPISKDISKSARLPSLFPFLDRSSLEIRAHIGFLIAIAIVAAYWWLLNKSKLGFEFRTYGANADAARYAGMSPARLTILAMFLSGAIAGLAGGSEILGGVTQGHATSGLAGDVGFDAIAVALLGASTPIGTAGAALLFGALKAGGNRMQAHSGVPVDLVLVMRALIVLFVAAPALTRLIWRVKQREGEGSTQLFRGWGG
jgi:simple sugar transport system permease protein